MARTAAQTQEPDMDANVAEATAEVTDTPAAEVTEAPTGPTISAKLAGFNITSPTRFAEGHVMSAPEAKWASKALVTTLGNALANKARAAEKAKSPAPFTDDASAQAVFDKLYADFSFGVRDAAATKAADTEESFVRDGAAEAVKALIKSKGLKITDFFKAKVTVADKEISKYDHLISQWIAANPDKVDALKAQYAARADTLSGNDTELDFTL